jgi:predicted PolB exonuclease-like 3'-5' exonuclease
MEDRLICIGVMDVDTKEKKIFIEILEEKTLQIFWDYIKDYDEVITFNGAGFDIPYLIKRSLIKNIPISRIPQHIDLRKTVNGFFYSYNNKVKGTLRDWALLLGKDFTTCEGGEVPALFVKQDFDSIIKHNSEDLDLTFAIYERCKTCRVLT